MLLKVILLLVIDLAAHPDWEIPKDLPNDITKLPFDSSGESHHNYY